MCFRRVVSTVVKIASFSQSQHVKFLTLHKWKEGLAAMQIHQYLVNGGIEFVLHFAKSRGGWLSLNVGAALRQKLHTGWQVTSLTRGNINQIRQLIEEDPHLSIKMIQEGTHINSKYYRCKIFPQVINHMK